MTNTTIASLAALSYQTMPQDQGQIVTVSYAVDWDRGILACRTYDASDRTTVYDWAEIDSDNTRDFEPQNGVLPKIDGEWTRADDGTAHTIQCRHASGSSEWEPEPECVGLSRDEAERVLATLEPTDDDGAALEYRIVQD